MFGRSLFNELRDDPFFSHHSALMGDMNQMMANFHGSFGLPPGSSIMSAPRLPHQITPFNGIAASHHPAMFGNMDAMFSGLQNSGLGQSYSSTKIMSYSNTGQGQPKYYEATSSITQGPNGVRQTRNSERNSVTGLDRMAVGHHINERGHIMERSRNRHTNEREEKQDFINIDEEDKDSFHREWKEKSRSGQTGRSIARNHRNEPHAIKSAEHHRDITNRQIHRHTERRDDRRDRERHGCRHRTDEI